MHFKIRNVNDGFKTLVEGIHLGTIQTNCVPSRYGEVIRIEEPVIVSYSHPSECVLLNQERDANCAFHLFESLWMLAGRDDVAPLEYYNPKMKEFSDDGIRFHGAYGFRWRSRFGYDQLKEIMAELKVNPFSRRCVLQMWDAGATPSDLYVATHGGKDVPCNVAAFFEVEDEKFLNMTVLNRSNDLIWGLLGANAVHFVFLQMYVAGCLGLQVGQYHQVTNNLHCYTERWTPEKWLEEYRSPETSTATWYTDDATNMVPLVRDPETFDKEVLVFADKAWGQSQEGADIFTEPFLKTVAWPMYRAFERHKHRDYRAAWLWLDAVAADDWREAGRYWIAKRQKNYEAKNAAK